MKWYTKYLSVYEKPFAETSLPVAKEIKAKISRLQSDKPLVTVSVIAYNEEKHLLSCLWSLSDMQCKYPVEIIGVDNDSKDRTAEIFEAQEYLTTQKPATVADGLAVADWLMQKADTTLI